MGVEPEGSAGTVRGSEASEAILQAAMTLFAQKGFSATTTRQIAQEAGVNEVTLFRHFRSKADLFNRILEEIRRLYPPLLALDDLSRTGPEEAIREFCRLTLRRVREAPQLVRLLFYAMLDEVHELRDTLVEQRVGGYRDVLSQAFARLQKAGQCDPAADPDTLARLLMSQVFGLAMMSLLRMDDVDIRAEEKLAAQISGQFIRPIQKAPAAPPRAR